MAASRLVRGAGHGGSAFISSRTSPMVFLCQSCRVAIGLPLWMVEVTQRLMNEDFGEVGEALQSSLVYLLAFPLS